jgi:hypothetical protein
MPITAPAPAPTKQRPPGLRNTPLGWLTAASAAGLDEDGMVALFTSAPRDIHKRRGAPADRADAASGETEDVA